MYQSKLDTRPSPFSGDAHPSRSLTSEFVFLSQNAATCFIAEALIDVLRSVNRLTEEPIYSWKHHIWSGNPDCMKPCKNDQTLVLVGGTHEPWLPSEDLLDFLRSCIRSAARVCVVGSGVFIPLRAGILRTQPSAVHPNFRLAVRESGYLADFPETSTHHHKSLSSASGLIPAVEMLIELIAAREGTVTAQAVRDELGLQAPDSTVNSKECLRYSRLAAGEPVIGRAMEIMLDHLEETLTIAEIAEDLGISLRHLERSFGEKLLEPPSSVYRNLRLEQAHNLLVQTKMSLQEISIACGFSSAKLLSKWYCRNFGLKPTQSRKQAFFGRQAA